MNDHRWDGMSRENARGEVRPRRLERVAVRAGREDESGVGGCGRSRLRTEPSSGRGGERSRSSFTLGSPSIPRSANSLTRQFYLCGPGLSLLPRAPRRQSCVGVRISGQGGGTSLARDVSRQSQSNPLTLDPASASSVQPEPAQGTATNPSPISRGESDASCESWLSWWVCRPKR